MLKEKKIYTLKGKFKYTTKTKKNGFSHCESNYSFLKNAVEDII